MRPNNGDFTKLDLFTKLTFLEDLVFNKITNEDNKNNNFNNDIKLLLDIIKLKFKVKPDENLINYIDLLNELSLPKKNNKIVKTKNGKTTSKATL